jgi:hypothetical protein
MSRATLRVLKCGRCSPPPRRFPSSRSRASSASRGKADSGGRESTGVRRGVISACSGVEPPVPRGSKPIRSYTSARGVAAST